MTREEKLLALKQISDPMGAVLSHIQLLKGDPGEMGPPGKDGSNGKNGANGRDGTNGLQGPQGKPGRGSTGPAGKDGRDGKDGATPVINVQEIIDTLVKEITARKLLKVDHVEGLTGSLSELRNYLRLGGFRGGGDTVAAGTGVTITTNSTGSKVINSSGGGGFTVLAATEIPNGSIATFTFPAATVKPSFLVLDYAQKPATSASGLVNWTWNNATKQATLNTAGGQCPPPNEDIYAIV